jgi:hypothetical protein
VADEVAPEESGDEPGESIASLIPRWAAVAVAVALVIGIVLLIAYLPSVYGRTANSPEAGAGADASPTPFEYQESPLVSAYDVQGTPTLVFGCTKKREGTWLESEESGQLPAGTERLDIINELCGLTGRGEFCADSGPLAVSGVLTGTNISHCDGEGGRVLVYAFHSPSCELCGAQRPVLSGLAADFQDALQIKFICTPLSDSDTALCRSGVAAGQYDE